MPEHPRDDARRSLCISRLHSLYHIILPTVAKKLLALHLCIGSCTAQGLERTFVRADESRNRLCGLARHAFDRTLHCTPNKQLR